MPGLARKIIIFAAVDGLFLLPHHGHRKHAASTHTKINYKTGIVTPCLSNEQSPGDAVGNNISIEAHGIAGVLKIAASSWLIAITKREPVAEIRGKQIYVITDIALIPLMSRSEAEAALTRVRLGSGKQSRTPIEDEDSDIDDDNNSAATDDEIDDVPHRPTHKRRSSIAEDVIGKKGVYGRFAEQWFSKRGWQVDQRRLQGLSSVSDLEMNAYSGQQIRHDEGEGSTTETDSVAQSRASQEDDEKIIEGVTTTLTPKLLRTTKLLFASSRSFYFSYDFDVTRSLATQHPTSRNGPLYKLAHPDFFWNRHLLNQFIDGNHDQFALPLMQGFVEQSKFEVPTKEGKIKSFFYSLISRRSVKRAGLRYLRRGVDDQGNVANFVETEQLLTDSEANVSFSFLQLRGSIPIFFQQSPFVPKPKPTLKQSYSINKQAFQQHFNKLIGYGGLQVINLVEKGHPEGIVGDMYEKLAKDMDEPKIRFEWFDFHSECRGMKFENVSRLLERVNDTIDEYGWTEERNNKVEKRQTGVLRVNCMDCLDRTNVVESACGRLVLEQQLESLGVDMTNIESNIEFTNSMWADNGDAISKQYSSTAALKGDFTRTKKRNISGAITDFGLSVTRYWNNMIGDFFTQAAIDYLLGNVSQQVFVEFEFNMMSADPAVSVNKVRQSAIETSSKIAIADESEELLNGWTVLAPHEDNTTRTMPFTETVLLLTNAAVYFCRFDYQMEKVSSFERIDLINIKKIQYGTYITSTLTPASIDPKLNIGFLIEYFIGKNDMKRINTRSLTSIDISRDEDAADKIPGSPMTDSSERILAFKALPVDSAVGESSDDEGRASSKPPLTVRVIERIAREIEAACLKGDTASGMKEEGERKGLVEKKEIIGLAEAKRSTGLIEQVSYSLKRLLWG